MLELRAEWSVSDYRAEIQAAEILSRLWELQVNGYNEEGELYYYYPYEVPGVDGGNSNWKDEEEDRGFSMYMKGYKERRRK